MNGTYTAVIDRIEDGRIAVLLLEDDGEVVDQLDVPVERLPEDGRREGAVLAVDVTGGEFAGADYRPAETASRRRSMQDRLDRLSERLSDQ